MLQRRSAQLITAYYEAAMWQSVRGLLPNVRLVGCLFHYSQALYRPTCQPAIHQSTRKLHMISTNITKQIQALSERWIYNALGRLGMRRWHTWLSWAGATDNNKILRTHPPQVSSTEENLPRHTRRTLAQLKV